MQNNPISRPFPSGWLSPYCEAPFALKLGMLSEYILSRTPATRALSRKKNLIDFQYLTMTSREHLILLRESLASMARTWESWPSITIINDGSWENSELSYCFKDVPNWVRVIAKEDLIENSIHPFASKMKTLVLRHPLGLKLFAIAEFSLTKKIFFADTDILWYRCPLSEISKFSTFPILTGSEDIGTFDNDLMRELGVNWNKGPFPNTGVVTAVPGILTSTYFENLLDVALRCPPNRFTEQSILGLVCRKEGNLLPNSFMSTDFGDYKKLSFRIRAGTDSPFGRHYAGSLRHQFYRDALAQRIGKLFNSGGFV